MVAEDGVALRGCESGENFGADASGFEGERVVAGAAADEVSCEEDQLGVERVDAGYRCFEEGGFGVFLEVDI